MKNKLAWKELPWYLRLSVVVSFLIGALWLLSFIMGFIIGLSGV